MYKAQVDKSSPSWSENWEATEATFRLALVVIKRRRRLHGYVCFIGVSIPIPDCNIFRSPCALLNFSRFCPIFSQCRLARGWAPTLTKSNFVGDSLVCSLTEGFVRGFGRRQPVYSLTGKSGGVPVAGSASSWQMLVWHR